MKHLKYFNEAKWCLGGIDYDCQQDLQDICLELHDVGFNIEFFGQGYGIRVGSSRKERRLANKGMTMHLRITKGLEDPFRYREVNETVERVKDFMTMKGFSTKVEKIKPIMVTRLGHIKVPQILQIDLIGVLLTFTQE